MIQIQKVISQRDRNDFVNMIAHIYKEDKQWVRPLDKDIEAVFDPERNKYFRHGEAQRWILKNDEGKIIGRVAAFINHKTAKGYSQPTGGMGFFECIDDRDAAFMLFESCKKWLEERGMNAMDGPINFGERDRFWGLLVDGFYEPVYSMNYNQPYYRQLFESYGFKTYYEQYYFLFNLNQQIPDKYKEKSDRIARDKNYQALHIRKNQLEKFASDFQIIYNKAWAKYDNFKGISRSQAMVIIKALKPIMDEEIVWLAYYKSEPIAFFIMLPEINQIFKQINNGKLGGIEKLRFLWHKWRGTCRKMYGLAFGIIPEFQGRGVEGYIITAAAKHILPKNKYDELELTWIADFNPKMLHLAESLGTKKVRTAITYRKLFDENQPFERAPAMN